MENRILTFGLSLLISQLFFINPCFSQQPYWQQQTNYSIDAVLDDKSHTIKGNISIEYVNNSPDKLEYIWFHLWPNAYREETTAYAKQVFRDPEGKKRWKEMKEKGFIDSLQFTVNNEKLKTEKDKEHIDLLKVYLPKTLIPGEKTTITTPFFVKIPTYSSRSGRVDDSYIICQWYPKPAVYDKKGWHPIPYLDHGEFYGEFGKFDVRLTVPSAYVVGATGTLHDNQELNKYKELGKANNLSTGKAVKYKPLTTAPFKTLRYTADSVHDFAWFADKDFIVRYDTAKLASNKIIDIFTYGHENGNRHWEKSVSYVEDAIRRYSNWIGEYPYPAAQAVEGPKNVMSGGMEYPMITLITSPDADEPRMDAVIAHEVGHNWFYGILASNERDHAWMDEGINSYFQFRYEAEKYKTNTIFGDMLPAELKAKPLPDFMAAIYGAMSQIPMDEAIETPSADFEDKDKYGMVVYLKTAIWLYLVELSVGPQKLDAAIKSYFNNWKFKHPYPEDMKAEFEKALNIKLDDLFALLNKRGKFE